MTGLLAVAVGGALGASLRFGSGLLILRLAGGAYPLGTLFVNVVGSFLMGLAAGHFVLKGGSDELRLFVMTGLLGGFTTFSAFSLESLMLWQRGEGGVAVLYVAGQVALCLAAIIAGAKLIRAFA